VGNDFFKSLMNNLRSGALVFFRRYWRSGLQEYFSGAAKKPCRDPPKISNC
jgi:hypothetical protein